MYRKNVAGQFIYFVLVKAADGTALTGATVTAYRALDNGSQASATGTTTELANGQYRFNLSQADTNADYGSYLFTAATAVPVEKTVVFTAANPTDATAFGLSRLDAAITSRLAPTTAGRTLDVDGSGQITVGAMAANTLTASALATDAVDEIANATTQLLYSDIGSSNSVWDTLFWDRINTQVQTIYQLGLMIESNNLGDFRFDTFALSNAGDAQQSTLLQVKAKTDLITSATNFITVERVAGSTITMYYNEATTATVGLDEDTSSLTLRFVVENSDQLDVLVIENANITRTASNFTATITTAVTATLGQYRWALRDITGGVNRLIEGGVLQVVGAANKDA